MTAVTFGEWRTSSFTGSGDCVRARCGPGERREVGDSKDQNGPTLVFSSGFGQLVNFVKRQA
jgi:uncharacterized protein DUF397